MGDVVNIGFIAIWLFCDLPENTAGYPAFQIGAVAGGPVALKLNASLSGPRGNGAKLGEFVSQC